MQQIVHQDLHPYENRYILGPVVGSILLLYNFPTLTTVLAVVVFIFSIRWLLYNNKCNK
jgi:hypothetical protein